MLYHAMFYFNVNELFFTKMVIDKKFTFNVSTLITTITVSFLDVQAGDLCNFNAITC